MREHPPLLPQTSEKQFVGLMKHYILIAKCTASPGHGAVQRVWDASQQAKTDFRRQRWKSVLSVCIYKRPACPVAHFRHETTLPREVVSIWCGQKLSAPKL